MIFYGNTSNHIGGSEEQGAADFVYIDVRGQLSKFFAFCLLFILCIFPAVDLRYIAHALHKQKHSH